MNIRFTQVDAFAERAFAGNPAAVMPLATWLDDGVLQAIAAENNLSETAFLVPADGDADADYALRWFTPTVEVALCGHATLASAHVLFGDDPALTVLRFRTRQAGVLVVTRDGDGYVLDLPAWPAAAMPLPAIVAALGGSPVATLWRDGGYALVEYASEAAVRALAPDFTALKARGNILTIATARGDGTDIVSRVFAPGAGIDEDPVTGSAHSLLIPYWAPRFGGRPFTAFQASARGGALRCRLDGARVLIGGRCVTVIEGRFTL